MVWGLVAVRLQTLGQFTKEQLYLTWNKSTIRWIALLENSIFLFIWIIWCSIDISGYYFIPRPPKFCMVSSFLYLAKICGQIWPTGNLQKAFCLFATKTRHKNEKKNKNPTVVAGVNFWDGWRLKTEASSDTSSGFTASWPQVVTVDTMTRISLLWKKVLWNGGETKKLIKSDLTQPSCQRDWDIYLSRDQTTHSWALPAASSKQIGATF